MEYERLFSKVSEDELAKLCAELVSFDTTNPPGNERAAAEWVARYLEDLGFEAEFVPHGESRTTLVAHLKGSGEVPPLAFNGHLDVVPAGAQEWKYPPFGGEISEGKVWGRGSSDMKGGIAAMLVAAKAVATSGLSLKGDLIFLATSGEELDMMGAKSLTSRKDLAKAQAIIIAEPTDNEVVLTERGVFWPEFTTYGKTAHGSTPELGHNAIKDMMTLLLELEKTEIPYEPHPVAGRFSMSINTINGGVKTNVVPDKCVATVDMRTVPGQDHEALLSQLDGIVKRLEAKIHNFKASIRITNDLPPADTSPDEPVVKRFLEDAQSVAPGVKVGKAPFATEAAVFVPSMGVPTIIFGPGDPRLAHQPDEYVEISKMMTSARVFAAVASALLA